MKALRRAWHRLLGSWAGERAERELGEEMQAHLEMQIEANRREGMGEEEARRAALIAFGGMVNVKERVRGQRGLPWIEDAWTDLRYTLRTLGKAPGFAIVAVVTLALGIGANTAIFSFMDAILLRSLPVEDPESLVMLKFQRPGSPSQPGSRGSMSMSSTSGGNSAAGYSIFPFAAVELFRSRSDLFTDVFAYHGRPRTRLTVNGVASLRDSVFVSADFFRGLGIAANAGRTLTSDDDRMDAPPAAVISTEFARKWYGRESDALGKAVGVNGVNFTIAGVMPPGFFGVNPSTSPQVFLPLHSFLLTQSADDTRDGAIFQDGTYWLEVMARLKPGVRREQVQAALDPVFAEYFRENSGDTPERARLLVMEGAGGLDSLRIRYSRPLYVLLAMVGLILGIACANIANLLLARASARRKEMAVRLGMGAGRFRVIRQLITESVLLSVAGGAVGLLVAMWGVQALTALLAMGREDFTLRAELNWTVLGVTFAAAILTGALFGLAPAWQSTKVDLFSTLRATGLATGAPRRRWLPVNGTRALMLAQVTLSFLLLVGAGLFVRTLSKLQSIEVGFNRENLLILEINTQQAGYNPPAALEFQETLRQRLERIPGVRNATIGVQSQLSGGTTAMTVTVPGSQSDDQAATPLLPAGPDYLTTMQIPLLAGRDLAAPDRYRTPVAAVASESFARKHFGTDNPIGRRALLRGKQEMEIVGIAKDASYGSLKDKAPAMLYVDYHHDESFTDGEIYLVLRTAGDPLAIANTAREILRQADGGVPVTLSTQAAQIERTINQEIIFARLCSIFAGLALLIACVGLYGTTSYNVARRTSEIGIRMALGARRAGVLGMVLREVAVLGLVGLAIGVPVALMASKWVASFLFRLEPNDPVTFGAAFAILLAAAVLAGLVPAQRAARVDPMTALRHE